MRATRGTASPTRRRWSLSVLCMAVVACTPVHRHAVLDRLFDGVPPYLTPEERTKLAVEEAAQAEQAQSERPRGRGAATSKLSRFTHGPFAADECTRCHDLGQATGFRRGGESDSTGGSLPDLAAGGRLRVPVVQLCVRCHTDFSPTAPENEDLWLHGPVASGWCVLCHQPHSSVHPKLLTAQPAARLCGGCHAPEDLLATADHVPETAEQGFLVPRGYPETGDEEGGGSLSVKADCTRCHDPHRGSDRLLLKPAHVWSLRTQEPSTGDAPPTGEPVQASKKDGET